MLINGALRYPGGKTRVAAKLISYFPVFSEYREPFLGGGSVYLRLKQIYPDRSFWINDLNKNLYSFWACMKRNPEILIKSIQSVKDNKKSGKDVYFELKNLHTHKISDLAVKFFILNRITFSGLIESGGFSEHAFNGRFTQSSINRLQNLSSLLNKTKITNLDYESIIQSSGNDVFIYLDPPYLGAVKYPLYGNRGDLHKEFDYKRFASVLKSTDHKWLLTIDDSDRMRSFFKFANIRKLKIQYGMNNVKKTNAKIGNELLITNY
jgi:DNA adenine methylase